MALWELWPHDRGQGTDRVTALRADTHALEDNAERSLWWPYSRRAADPDHTLTGQ